MIACFHEKIMIVLPKKIPPRDGEVAQWFRQLATLPKDPSLIPRTHITTRCNSCFQGFDDILLNLEVSPTHVHTHIHK